MAEQAAALEAAQNAAEIAGVEAQLAHQAGGGAGLALGQLVDHARLGEREGAVEIAAGQQADLAGVKAVEPADGSSALGEAGGWHGYPRESQEGRLLTL